MKIKIVGAAGGEVTGSGYLIETEKAKIMVDAGMFQGGKLTEEKNRLPAGVDPRNLDALLLTHAHLDHTGRVPLLLRHGFRNSIYATAATLDLTEIVLHDAAKIQKQDTERKNRHNPDAHIEPLYEPKDMLSFRPQSRAVELHQSIPVAEGIKARFFEAGHILGSTSIELTIQEKGKETIVVFSGDLGPYEQPIVRPFEQLTRADLVFLESTYGNRDHRSYDETIKEFESIIQQAAEKKGKILIPAFAIGRTQQILYQLAILFFQKKVAPFPVFVDSPMATKAGRVFLEHPDLFDEEAVYWEKQGVLPLDPKWFKFTNSVEESKALNHMNGPVAILAGSGMCTGGRIQDHLKLNLANPSTQVLIVGFQGHGSCGRQLVDGAKEVRIHGEQIQVNAKIHTLNGFSAHAGQTDLLKWFSSMAQMKPKVVLTHGEDIARNALAERIEELYQITPILPDLNAIIER